MGARKKKTKTQGRGRAETGGNKHGTKQRTKEKRGSRNKMDARRWKNGERTKYIEETINRKQETKNSKDERRKTKEERGKKIEERGNEERRKTEKRRERKEDR